MSSVLKLGVLAVLVGGVTYETVKTGQYLECGVGLAAGTIIGLAIRHLERKEGYR